ncbi:thiamine phosphate synthase [Alphaproteobacteria bacterium]|nr:thiamine phosphate synthase [Alphaproteobacteria bacterium]
MSDYSTYFVAGPENILSNHQIGNENKEQTLVRIVKELAVNGLNVFQLRAKNLDDNNIIKLLEDLRLAVHNTNTKLCINDNVSVASKVGDIIDILHLGQSDMNPVKAKSIIDNNIEIGLSITNENQLDNIPDCVDYIGVGPIYKTNSKDDASEPLGENGLKNILMKTNIPVIAIGGISNIKVNKLFKLGVSGVAVISNILNNKNHLQNFLLLKKQIYKD